MDSSGDDESESELFDRYAFVALWVAGKYASRTALAAEWDDVHADASVGILDAIRKFDPARSITQKAYVFIRARGAAIDGIRQRGYRTRSGSMREPMSLDALLDAVDGESPWEPSMIERGYARIEVAETVSLLLARLSRRPRFVIEAYYLADRTLADIARELGVTESRISQIHTLALRQMRAMLAE